MLLSAFAFEVAGWLALAGLCFFGSWLLAVAAIYRSKVFEGFSKGSTAFGTSLSAVVLGVVFFTCYRVVLPAPFILRHKGAVVLSDFPQPLLYEYGNKTAAPIGLAINIEVINNQSIKTKIIQYFAEIQTPDGHWHRALSLPMSPPHTIYFLNLRRTDMAIKCGFGPAIFDAIADNKTLDPGEPLEGWAFFEWPVELRHTTVLVRKVKLSVKNAQDESTETIFDGNNLPPVEPGASLIDNGGVFCDGTPPRDQIDLSSWTIRPLRD
jgi:hypothetical protein